MDIEIRKIGAVGDGKTLCTELIQKAIDDCNADGGGRVIISAGTYLTGKLVMKSNVELHIAAGGILLGSADYKDYPEADAKHVESFMLPRNRNACLIYAEECENIAITGLGTIDCNGHHYVTPRSNPRFHHWEFERIETLTPPRVVFFTGCKNIKVEDVMMINQPAGWSYWIHDCDFVTFDKVKVYAELTYPNNDGIHINCSRDVSISNCSITCGDDCLVVRANSISLPENKVCERVTVTNCNLSSYANGVRVGWINDGVIRNCTFSNLVITDSNGGIDIRLPLRIRSSENVRFIEASNPVSADVGREETLIENLSFSNIVMDRMYEYPIRIFIDPDERVQAKTIRNIYFHAVHSRSIEPPYVVGREKTHLNNICFADCTFDLTDGSEFGPGGVVPAEKRMKPEIVAEHVDGLRLSNTVVSLHYEN